MESARRVPKGNRNGGQFVRMPVSPQSSTVKTLGRSRKRGKDANVIPPRVCASCSDTFEVDANALSEDLCATCAKHSIIQSSRPASITHEGEHAEERYRTLTNSVRTEKRIMGDAVFEGRCIEVKQTGGGNLGQVRCIKFIPLVALDTKDNQWYVIPPNALIREAAKKPRGQHCENSFESASLKLSSFSQYKVEERDLVAETRKALAEGDRHVKLRELMEETLDELVQLTARQRAKAIALIEEEDREEQERADSQASRVLDGARRLPRRALERAHAT